MDIRKRLFRKPLTTVLWGILAITMAAMLCIGVTMMYASVSLAQTVDKLHTSIAVSVDPDVLSQFTEDGDNYIEMENMHLFQEDVDFLNSLTSVEGVYFQTLTGGYCPSFAPLISPNRRSTDNNPYYFGMLSGEVTQIFKETDIMFEENLSEVGLEEAELVALCYLEVKVEEFLLANEDYVNPEGYINVRVYLAGQDAMDFFQVGERYVFFGKFDPSYMNFSNFTGMQFLPWLEIPDYAVMRDSGLSRVGWEFDMIGARYVFYYPVAEKLEGSVSDFLADPPSEEWAAMAEAWDILQHSLPILGTGSAESLYAFVHKDAVLEEGRFFTQEEYDTGAKVCMISQDLAKKSGIQVGDTISISQFDCGASDFEPDENESLHPIGDHKLNNPTLCTFTTQLEFLTQEEEFTVVGTYRFINGWLEGSYSFTPNTVLVPQKAQPEGAYGGASGYISMDVTEASGETVTYSAKADGATYGVFLTVKLKNGMISDFLEDMEAAGWADRFITVDQGYDKILSNLQNLIASSMKLLWAVAAGWILLLVLYLLLYQGTQRRNLGIMRSLGANPRQTRNYIFVSGMSLAAIGICVGTFLAAIVVENVQMRLLETAFKDAELTATLNESTLATIAASGQLPWWVLVIIATAQLSLFALTLWFQAFIMSKKSPRMLMGK